MRLHPAVTVEEATAYLERNAIADVGEEKAAKLAKNIATMAAAMANISAIEVEDELAPLFP